MPRVAVLADIHGNLPAFDAVLKDAEHMGVDEIALAGDLVGRGPEGNAVVQRAIHLGLKSVRGNHEDYLLSFHRREVPEGWLTAEEWGCSRWMAAELDEDALAYLEAMPFSMVSTAAPRLQIFHGSPASNNEGLGVWTDTSLVKNYLDDLDADVMVCGHTHRPASWNFDGRMVVNVGSVGLPFNGDTRAQYAILSENSGSWSVEFRQVEYDQAALFAAYESTGFETHGGATAALLRHEVVTARPHLVPFLKWAEALGVAPLLSEVPRFLASFDPEMSLKEQIRRLRDLQTDPVG